MAEEHAGADQNELLTTLEQALFEIRRVIAGQEEMLERVLVCLLACGHLLLADEINRSPAKVQSALLEVMQERQVTIGHDTFPVPDPFLVLATQNPIESEGTYPLPEAQVDRFMLKVLVDYPSHDEELTVVQRSLEQPPVLDQVLSLEELKGLQAKVAQVYVDPALISWTVDVATATREPRK